MTDQEKETIKNLTDSAFAYWTMLNAGLRSAQLKHDVKSVSQFTNEVKIIHSIVSDGVKLCKSLEITPSFETIGNSDEKPLDDSNPTSPIILP